jgi:hypothetical protein
MAQLSKVYIKLPTERTPVSRVIAEGESVYAGMVANALTFPSPLPTMPDFLVALNLLKAAKVPEKEKNFYTTDLLRKRQVDFINNFLKPNSLYVLQVANGDRYIASLRVIP